MCGRRDFLKLIAVYAWIHIFGGTKVDAYFNDVLNPVKVNLDVWQQRSPRVAIRRNDNELSCEKPSVYICEEPLETVPPEATKECNYRNQRYHEQLYRWVAGRGCLLYTPDFLYVEGNNPINLNAGCFYGTLFAPCLEIPKDDGTCGCYPFDPGLEEVANAVRRALIPAAHGRWERCFYAASDCCSHYMLSNNVEADPTQCQATFDGWTCWQAAEAGSVSYEICSEFAYSGQGPVCHHLSSKECYNNATWEIQTDYSTCSITPRLLRRYHFYIAALSFSIASCLPAVFIFFFYKRLRITRVALHRNLLIVIIIRNILVIISRSTVYIDELTNPGDTIMSTHGIACRILAVLERIAGNAVFICMLVEGIYLHRLIVAVFRKKLPINWLYGIGAVLAILPVIAWAIVMGLHDDHSCWVVYTIEHIQWILDAPRLLILLINTVLFIDVLRVLLTKIRNAENSNQLSTTKATMFLMPIFGTQFLLTALRPSTTNCNAEQIYYYISYSVEGLQGFIVAVLYCYVNKEVHTLIKATYKKTENAVVSRIHGNSTYPRMSLAPNSDRRMTYSTALSSNNEEPKGQYATITPKLHVAEIISIQASERLAEILDPVYETINTGVINEGYDSLERSEGDNDSGIIRNRESKIEEYYGFTNASSVSIDCQDWIRCISSPSSSVYENDLNEYETKYLENKFPHHQKIQDMKEGKTKSDKENKITHDYKNVPLPLKKQDSDVVVNQEDDPSDPSLYEDCENMLDEIMQYMELSETRNDNVKLDPKLLCPYKKEDEKIVFVDDV